MRLLSLPFVSLNSRVSKFAFLARAGVASPLITRSACQSAKRQREERTSKKKTESGGHFFLLLLAKRYSDGVSDEWKRMCVFVLVEFVVIAWAGGCNKSERARRHNARTTC